MIRPLLAALSLCLAPAWAAAAPPPIVTVVHPAAESTADARGHFPTVVLGTALSRAGMAARLEAYPVAATQERAFRLLEAGRLDVVWSMATADRAERFRLVPRPIDRGLLGWRVLLARADDIPRLRPDGGAPRLQTWTLGQGHDWPDAAILEANHLRVARAPSYESLFGMLASRRIDAAPRAISEALREQDERRALRLSVVPGLLLHYPAALAFHVRKGNEALAGALERGLDAMKADGTLEALFEEAYREDLERLGVDAWPVIELANPDAPPAMPAVSDPWWWRPAGRP